ncbi:MAG: NADH-quinone oxidoreductase subunit A [Anaerolineales bacterium]
MIRDYLPIAIMLGVSVVLAILVVALGHLLGPRRPSDVKSMPYESGMVPVGPAIRRIPVRFYLVAVLFILFDIEVIFFLPWAVSLKRLGMFGLIEMFVFVAFLLVGYAYVWKRGALDWE